MGLAGRRAAADIAAADRAMLAVCLLTTAITSPLHRHALQPTTIHRRAPSAHISAQIGRVCSGRQDVGRWSVCKRRVGERTGRSAVGGQYR